MKKKNTKEQQSEANEAARNARSADKPKSETEELNDKLSKEHDAYVKLLAEFDTFRRRTAEEKLTLVKTASEETIKELLPVLDACEQALKMLENSSDPAALEGTRLIYGKLMNALGARGLSIIEAKGKDFNSDEHEAIAQIPAPSEDLKGKVIEVTRTGYILGGKIVRYPQVVVGL
ncbi:MAG: nucleotide exchange factor GrpE [Bacteroidales bacterium]|mgnify:CR=1 FL=1|nr:nucleotide exchange factor GrpE [Bacteroidales bacterium]